MGAKLVFPGRFLAPVSLAHLMEEERITVAAGVPTIWIGMLAALESETFDLSALWAIYCGGSVVPQALIEGLAAKDINIVQAWGMTETSPIAAVSNLCHHQLALPLQEQFRLKARQGTVLPCVDLRAVDLETGQEVPWDDHSYSELEVRGPWIAHAYLGESDSGEKFVDGWMRTGDVVVIDEDGTFQIIDRSKDLVKSGGEWISSVELESLLMGHPKVAEACVIGVPHPTWGERPLAYVVAKTSVQGQVTEEELLEYLRPRIAKWWLPDRVVFVAEIPHTSVGKFDKKLLRRNYELSPRP